MVPAAASAAGSLVDIAHDAQQAGGTALGLANPTPEEIGVTISERIWNM